MERLKVGILTAGNIAGQMGATLKKMEQVDCVAVTARDLKRAQDFAKSHGFRKAYGSYEELVQDPEVELVYIGSPHSHHYEQAKLCLQHGKHVLCEKAFTANAAQAEELILLAREKGLFLMEAVWTRFLPLAETLRMMLDREEIGRVRMVTADLGFPLSHIQRMQQPALAGGALLDLGIYPLTFASMVLGDQPVEVSGSCVKTELGVDEQNSITLTYRDGSMAVLHSSMTAQLDCRGVISGTEGYLAVDQINNWAGISVYDRSGAFIKRIPQPVQISGYEYEVLECQRCIRQGLIESPVLPHAESLRLMKLMDGLRKDWGIQFPFEGGERA